MNGVFKFKENIFLKYKKEISLTAVAFLTLASVVKFIPDQSVEDKIEVVDTATTPVVEEVVESNGFNVFYGDALLGTVASENVGHDALARALELMIDELGYNPDMTPDILLDENYSLEANYMDVDELAVLFKDSMIAGLDSVKVKAYVMKIGDDFTVALNNTDDIKEVLKNAQASYVNSSEFIVDINLACDERNSLVMTPEIVMLKESVTAPSRTFTGDLGDGDETEIVADDTTSIESDDNAESEDQILEEAVEEEKDPYVDGETVAVGFAESVMIVETYVDPDTIQDVDAATELITKENEEAKVYTVVSGDVPSIIAENNEMNLSDLYALNPDLKGNERKMQIGDELIVMVPEPELSVSTKEEVVYTRSISQGTTYVDDATKYETSKTTIDNGYAGVMQVTAVVEKVNGEEIDRVVTDETVIKEPKDRVVSRGTKPLPPKGATGQFISPLESYRITSTFGYRWGGFHYGVDLAAPTGTTVRASDGGTVTIAGWQGNYGYLVEIDHGNGIRTRYGHNSKIVVSVGQVVSQYEKISECGSTGRSTGPHVHFEIRFDGVCVNPLDYMTR